MSNGRLARVTSVALCILVTVACRTMEPISDTPDSATVSADLAASSVVDVVPEALLAPHRMHDTGGASESVLAAPDPPYPEPSLSPARPIDLSLDVALLPPGIAAAVAFEEAGRGEVDSEVRDTSPTTPVETAGRAAPATIEPDERADTVRPTLPGSRTDSGAASAPDRSGTTPARADDTQPSASRGDRSPAIGSGRVAREPVADLPPSGGAAPPVDRAPVSSQGPSGAASTGREDAFPISQDTTTTRSVRPGDLFVVQLPGQSWIFVGPTDGVEFVDRRTVAAGIEFVFRLRESEDGSPVALRFESQDLVDGSRRTHTETVASSDSARLVQRDDAMRTDGAAPGESGAEHDATLRGPAETSSVDDLTLDTEEIIAALERGDSGALDASDEDLRQTVALLGERNEYALQGRLLEALLRAGMLEGDWILYTLARMFESPWDGRDIRRARDTYLRLVNEYPFSRYWDAAGERIEFLNRHFFYIR